MPESENNQLDEFIAQTEAYFNTRQELARLKAIEKVAVSGSTLSASLTVLIIFSMAVLFASVALALVISDRMGRPYLGFLIVACGYFFFALLLFVMKDKWLRKPLMNSMIKNIFKDDHAQN
jgi:hypothetical protein